LQPPGGCRRPSWSGNGADIGPAEVAGGVDLGDVRCDVKHSDVSLFDAALRGNDVGSEIGAGENVRIVGVGEDDLGCVSAELSSGGGLPLLRSNVVVYLRVLKLSRRALAVQTGAGTLASRERRQAHHLEQLRSFFMEQRIPIVGCGRRQVGGFNVRHAPRVSAETNATVTIPPIPFLAAMSVFLTSTMLGRDPAEAR
jgi:hypothetical protein